MKQILNKILFYDFETSDMPNWKEPSDDPCQPHIVQVAGVLCDEDTGSIISSLDLIVKPDGWEISEETIAIHGITPEYAAAVGVNEGMAIMMLQLLCGDADRAAYNKTFDQRIGRIASKRFLDESLVDRWAIKEDHHDPMRMVQKVYGGKNMKLEDAYLKVTGKTLLDAHSAMADTLAAKDIYFALRGHQALTH